MLDVRNAIARLLDRYTLADIVQITLRKLRRDKVTPPFLPPSIGLGAVLASTVNLQDRAQSKLNSLSGTSQKRSK